MSSVYSVTHVAGQDPPATFSPREKGCAPERGETIVVTRNGKPVANIGPQSKDRADDPEWRASFAALKKSLRSKRRSGYRVGTVTEDDTYGDDVA